MQWSQKDAARKSTEFEDAWDEVYASRKTLKI